MFSSFELIDIIISLAGQLDSVFNYWISASFAVIVSSYIGKEHFNFQITLSISILYLLASLMFMARLYFMGAMLQHYLAMAGDALPPDFDSSILALSLTRGPTFLIGFLVTEYYLWHSYNRNRDVDHLDT